MVVRPPTLCTVQKTREKKQVWKNRGNKSKYPGDKEDAKAQDKRKYRHKVRASMRWMRGKDSTEAKEANIRERRNRTKKISEKNTSRKGGAGGRGKARAVDASSVEEELINNIGSPQHTWRDGSCWLWAVAGALHKLKGRESPTENDIRLEKEWRAAIQDTGKEYDTNTHERLTRGGTWGGGKEHQALAMYLKINIVIWDRRFIGRVGAQHRQLYVCTPQGDALLKNITHTTEWLKQNEFATIHILYDDVAKHYEYFGNNDIAEDTGDERLNRKRRK
eukprot:4236072-Pleurochrysis_carterae.AAC.2